MTTVITGETVTYDQRVSQSVNRIQISLLIGVVNSTLHGSIKIDQIMLVCFPFFFFCFVSSRDAFDVRLNETIYVDKES